MKASRRTFQRERKEILLKICEGLSNQEIAETLFISKRTVDKHRANLLGKTNSKNTASLILFAIRNKLIADLIVNSSNFRFKGFISLTLL